ncbi:MAG: class I SAM-dependent methyltransferase [Actinomycetota bacterium]
MNDEHGGVGEAQPGRPPGTMSAADWDARYRAGRQWSVEPNRFLVEQLTDRPVPAGRALDLACGEGRNALWLAAEGWDVLGVDVSEVGIERGRAAAGSLTVDLRVGDALTVDVDLADDRGDGWDLVLVSYLHLPSSDRRRLLERVRWALAPGATFLLIGHDLRNLRDGWGGPTDPEVLWSPKEVAADFSPSRFSIEAAGVVERTVETELGPRIALDTLVRLRATR